MLFWDTTQVATVNKDPTAILSIDSNINQYYPELQTMLNLQTELGSSYKNNSKYASYIRALENNLKMANDMIHIFQIVTTNTPTLLVIELPHPPEFCGDSKELPNCISKVRLKFARENHPFIDEQYKLCYVYGYLIGNMQNQIQSFVQSDKIALDNVEAPVNILEAAFREANEVRKDFTKLV
jgi:hypothetical protein